MSKLVICALALALAASLLAGCGSSKSSSTASTATTVAQPSVNAAIAAQVPEAIKKKGTLTVASEAQYAPNEFIAPDGHTVIGMDPDMVKALAAVMGLKANVVNSTFEAIIPGLAAGRYDIGASSFTDTKEREKTVDFVTYLSVGEAFLSKANGGPQLNTLAELCGHTVSVEKGTTELEDAEKQNKKCKEAGKPIKLLIFPGQNDANLALSSGRAEVDFADSPIIAYQVRKLGVNVRSSQTFGTSPEGLALPKGNGMAKPVLEALKVLMANGTYQAILRKWELQSAAISNPTINGATR
ncbi:MAG: ABC transporter substrate-binding protein [Actinobacteria bacterium]|nr:MAG: ABC transporter substrate-binding protein [Actinomycetota bacterium]